MNYNQMAPMPQQNFNRNSYPMMGNQPMMNQQQGYYSQPISNIPQMNSYNPFIKIVDSYEAARATDVPMDGNIYYMPKADGTEIYAKRWLPNFTTSMMSYIPVMNGSDQNEQQSPSAPSVLPLNDMMTKLDSIDERMMNIEKSMSQGFLPQKQNQNSKQNMKKEEL